MQFDENVSLLGQNTFGIDARARYYTKISSVEQLSNLAFSGGLPVLVLGGGSNVLFTRDFNGYVLQNRIMGIDIVREDDSYVYLKTGAGENWHGFVEYCIARNYGGVENLALIPGCNGASPIQNIGAYGVEIKDVFHELEAFHLESREIHVFTHADCRFGYRDSIFKRESKGKYLISSVTYRLRKVPEFNISYGAIRQELDAMGVQELSVRAIGDAVIRIRRSKLPDPAQIGNAGSFFKNPEISAEHYDHLREEFPGIVGYALDNGRVKLAAGWLIEKAGWKGFRRGDAGVHARQALVLVNYGNASGQEIFDLSEELIRSIYEKFHVTLEREVNVL